MKSSDQYREEYDTLGKVMVPADAYYGSQTQRDVDNFQISGIRFPRSFIKAQRIIKASAALAHIELGKLSTEMGEAIIAASEEVIDGKLGQEFSGFAETVKSCHYQIEKNSERR